MKRFIGKLLGAGAVVLAAAVVAACGGGNSSDSTPVAPPDAPVITSAIRGVSGTGTVTVTGTAQTGVTVTVTWPDNTDCDTAAAADGSWGCTSSAMTYALGQTVSAVAKNSLGTSRTVTAIIMGFTTSKLPDTGITADQCYQAGSNLPVSCTSTGALALNGLQDGNITPGATGMSYSSVGNYPITSCVKDNITGLIWEGKEASGLRAGGTLYTHYDSSFADSQDMAESIIKCNTQPVRYRDGQALRTTHG